MKRRFHDLLEYALTRGSELSFAHHRLSAANVCASSAQWHVLGFIHINLVSAGRETLRLHLWRHVLGTESLWSIHNHSYELTSLVVAGCLQDRRFSVVPDPEALNQLYEVRYRENGSERIKLDRRIRCMEVGHYERETDETYGIPLGVFHSSLLTADCPAAVTIVQTGCPTKSRPRVVGTADGAQVYDYVTCAVDEDTLDEWSRYIIEELRLW